MRKTILLILLGLGWSWATLAGAAESENTPGAALVQSVPDELLAKIGLRLTGDEQDQPAAWAGRLEFQRASGAYAAGQVYANNSPRLVAGKFGRGLLLEDAHCNLLTAAQASAAEQAEFSALLGAQLSINNQQYYEGQESLQVATPGNQAGEGLTLAALVTNACYDGLTLAPLGYVASLYLKGRGCLLLSLENPDEPSMIEPVQADLSPDQWKRFSCVYSANFAASNIGPGHAADWSNLLPTGLKLTSKLQLRCRTATKHSAEFFVDAIQLEPREFSGGGRSRQLAPLSWLPGQTAAQREALLLRIPAEGPWQDWHQAGAISFWFKPDWSSSDGGRELLLALEPAGLRLRHANSQIQFQPAGIEFQPYDWKDKWHHIAISWNQAGRLTLFLDGYDYLQSQPKPLSQGEALLTLGGSSGAPNGVVDELILFHGTLSLEQAKAISAYELGRASNSLGQAAAQPPRPAQAGAD